MEVAVEGTDDVKLKDSESGSVIVGKVNKGVGIIDGIKVAADADGAVETAEAVEADGV